MSKRLHLFCFLLALLASISSSACGDSCLIGVTSCETLSEDDVRFLEVEKKINECIDRILAEEEQKKGKKTNKRNSEGDEKQITGTKRDNLTRARRYEARVKCLKELNIEAEYEPPPNVSEPG